METPLANAAKREWLFMPVPITLAFSSADPKDFTYCRTNGPMTEADPASARPNPSRMDFLPRSMTSGGMSEYFVLMMNSATDFVSPGALGNSAAGPGAADTPLAPIANVDSVNEFLNKSRRFITAYFPSLVGDMPPHIP